jgi:hypothetical protein
MRSVGRDDHFLILQSGIDDVDLIVAELQRKKACEDPKDEENGCPQQLQYFELTG